MAARKLVGTLGCLSVLAACDQPSVRQAPLARPPLLAVTPAKVAKAITDTAALATLAGVPGSPYVQTKTVAPGIEVILTGLPVADTVRDAAAQRLVLSVRAAGHVIYRDTTEDRLAFKDYMRPQSAHLYPLWVPTGPGEGQLLVASSNRPDNDLVRRFTIAGGRVVRLDTLPEFDGPARDLDHDGWLEYNGSYSTAEEADDAAGHPGATYDLDLYYEVRATGLLLDSALTKQQASKRFGGFYGYKPRSDFVPPAQPGTRRERSQ